MLKFLTHKLRTHSLNEESISEKVDGHDSGTESDDEIDRPDSMMASRASSVSPTESRDCSGCECASPSHDYSPLSMPLQLQLQLPLMALSSPHRHDINMRDDDAHYDHHSSEEELEVINSTSQELFSKYECVESEELECDVDTDRCSPLTVSPGCRGATRVAATTASAVRAGRRLRTGPPEKRKWAQARDENDENARGGGGCGAAHANGAPVLRFRTSPPLEALKPRGPPPTAHAAAAVAAAAATPLATSAPPPPPLAPHNSPPTKVFHLSADATSPRKRTRHIARRHIQRPCLDFDKMQQLKVRPVTAWRHGAGEHSGELSVFCW